MVAVLQLECLKYTNNLHALVVSGLLVYFGYGYKHSVESTRQREITHTQLIISQTQDFGKEVEEYPLASE